MTNILQLIPKDEFSYASNISLNLSRDSNEDQVIRSTIGFGFCNFYWVRHRFFIKVFHDAVLSHANSPKPTHPISIVL